VANITLLLPKWTIVKYNDPGEDIKQKLNIVCVGVAHGVTEIPFVDESSEWELLSLLGDWYEPKSFDSIFSSLASDAVFFS